MKKNSAVFKSDVNFKFACNKVLPSIELVYETYGEINADKTNAVLVCHAFSGSHEAAGLTSDGNKTGWWDEIIGPGKAIDTEKYFVVSVNNLGSCYGSSGPKSISTETNEPYGSKFPDVCVLDWVNSQKLLMDELGIRCWEMVAGGSLGGMQALQWAVSYPEKIKRAAIIAATAQTSPQNIALNEVARQIIRKDSSFNNGEYISYNTTPKEGLKTARMLGHITYLSETNIQRRFGRKKQAPGTKVAEEVNFEIENYLQYKGDQFSEFFDANSYILMTKAMDEYNLADQFEGSMSKALERIKSKLLIISFTSDWLFPSWHSRRLQKDCILSDVESSFIELEGSYGHDSFLFASPEYSKILKTFLGS